MSGIKLIAGLGNPGAKYSETRHNVGFKLLDSFGNLSWQDKFSSKFSKTEIKNHQLYLQKPQTFMNNSGEAVAVASKYFNINSSEILVIHDDLDLALGTIRLKRSGGNGGHNGLRSIDAMLSTTDYYRLRIGIGKPLNSMQPTADWVLGKFSKEETETLLQTLNTSRDCILHFLEHGFLSAQNRFN